MYVVASNVCSNLCSLGACSFESKFSTQSFIAMPTLIFVQCAYTLVHYKLVVDNVCVFQ